MKKKEVAFLTGPHHPDFSAVSYCGYQIQRCLSDEFNVTVVAMRTQLNQPSVERFAGIKIRRIATNFMEQRLQLLAKQGGRLGATKLLSHRMLGALGRLLSPVTLDRQLIDAFHDELCRLPDPPDVIIPQVFPFETVQAALSYKREHPGTQVIPYLFDDFVDSASLHVSKVGRAIKRQGHLKLEQTMLEESDAVIAMHPLRQHFEKNFASDLVRSISFLEHPLLTPPGSVGQRKPDGGIRICYTGSFIQGVREPDYVIRLLRELDCEKPITANFYVKGNAARRVPTEETRDNVTIINHGQVEKQIADQAVNDADILLNLGESKGRQVSSKVFEYMATGKPIIHISFCEHDIVSNLLSRYPLAFCVRQNEPEFKLQVKLISDFISSSLGRSIPFDTVLRAFPEAEPTYTSHILSNLIRCGDN